MAVKYSSRSSSKAIEIGGELYIQSFYRDITEKKRMQEQLMQSQEMESVASPRRSASPIIPTISCTAILGYSELLLEFSAPRRYIEAEGEKYREFRQKSGSDRSRSF